MNICKTYRLRHLIITLPVFGAAAILFFWLNFSVFPMAPHKVTITSGPKDGMYILYAQQYAKILRRYGLEVAILESPGSAENLLRLRTQPQKAQIGIVEGGTNQLIPQSSDYKTYNKAPISIQTIANIDIEPIWIFTRKGESAGVYNFAGKRIGLPKSGSGSRLIMFEMLRQLGHQREDYQVISSYGTQAIEDLIAGKTDIAMYVAPLHAPYIQKMLNHPKLELSQLKKYAALSEHMPYLELRSVYKGSINPARGLPVDDTVMLTTMSNLVVSDNLHPAIKRLIAQAAHETRNQSNAFYKANEFPNLRRPDYSTEPQAKSILRMGLQGFENRLTLQQSQWLWRLLYATPILFLLYWMCFNFIPSLIRNYLVRCINRWYGELSFIEHDMRESKIAEIHASQLLTQLHHIELTVDAFDVPKDLVQRIMMLKHHIHNVRMSLYSQRGR